MENTWIKATVVSPELKVGNVNFNKDKIIESIHNLNDSSIIVFPELSLTGYTCQDLFFQDTILSSVLNAIVEIKNATLGLKNTIVIGAPLSFKNKLYNCAIYISDGKISGIVPKIFIPNYGEFYEARWFASGRNIIDEFFEIDGERIPFSINLLFEDKKSKCILGTEICEDLWVSNRPSINQTLNGANIICNLSASDETIGKQSYRRTLVKQVSAEEYCLYLYSSSGKEESSTDLVFSGHQIIAYNGTIIKENIYLDNTRYTSALIDMSKCHYDRIHQSTYENDSDKIYHFIPCNISNYTHKNEIKVEELVSALRKENLPIEQNPFVPKNDAQRKQHCEEILKIQTMGLVTRLKNTGIRNCIIGVSGGLDSTLALIVLYEAKKILNDINIYGYTLPNKGNTSSLTYTNSLALMEALDIKSNTIAIEEGVNLHLKQIGHPLNYEGNGDVTYENAQARMRTYLLMDLANYKNGIVIGTGDLSELALGWCTYNGDHMSMYGVNCSVPKTLVKYIVTNYADTIASPELAKILHSIVDTPISPELTPNKDGKIAQKTEDSIGKYDLNDFFLYYFLRYGMNPGQILTYASLAYPNLSKEFLKENLKRFYNRFYHQQFKRSCLPDGPKVGSVTLSPRGDFRMSSDVDVSSVLEMLEKE